MLISGARAWHRFGDAGAVHVWTRIATLGAKTATIELRSPWENGSVESVNARLRDELPNREIFPPLRAVQPGIEVWRRHDNTARHPGALGPRSPAPDTILSPSRPCTDIPPKPIDRAWSAVQTAQPAVPD